MPGERVAGSCLTHRPALSRAAKEVFRHQMPCFVSDLFQSVELRTTLPHRMHSLRWRVMEEKRQWMGWTGQCKSTWTRRTSGRWGSLQRIVSILGDIHNLLGQGLEQSALILNSVLLWAEGWSTDLQRSLLTHFFLWLCIFSELCQF